jgi:hypothetical protein
MYYAVIAILRKNEKMFLVSAEQRQRLLRKPLSSRRQFLHVNKIDLPVTLVVSGRASVNLILRHKKFKHDRTLSVMAEITSIKPPNEVQTKSFWV